MNGPPTLTTYDVDQWVGPLLFAGVILLARLVGYHLVVHTKYVWRKVMDRPKNTLAITTEDLVGGDVVWLGDSRYNVYDVDEGWRHGDASVQLQQLDDDGRVIAERTVQSLWSHEWAVSSRLPQP